MKTFKCIGLKESIYLWNKHVEVGGIYELNGIDNAFDLVLRINDEIMMVDADQFEEVKP